jgi:hypothetical protein
VAFGVVDIAAVHSVGSGDPSTALFGVLKRVDLYRLWMEVLLRRNWINY